MEWETAARTPLIWSDALSVKLSQSNIVEKWLSQSVGKWIPSVSEQ